MTHVDWTEILAGRGVVDFSSLEIPEHRDEIERNVVQIRVHGRFVIDVAWIDEDRKYVATLFQDTYENTLAELECSTPSEVVEAVRQLIDQSESNLQSGASRNTTSSNVQFCQYA